VAYKVHYGKEIIEFALPLGWRLMPARPVSPAREPVSVAKQTALALKNPLGASDLAGSLKPGDRVAIITDDGTRQTPVREMLPTLLSEILGCGVDKEAVDIVVGLGTHAPMTQDALIHKLGSEVIDNFRVAQHDCRSIDLKPVGKLSTGAEVSINPLVARAQVKIGLGVILPHPMNGFGGGPKIVFPAVANYDAIREHHLAWTTDPQSVFGSTRNNPFLKEVASVAKMAGLTYSLNCVFDLDDQVASVLFGSWQAVHKEGGKLSQKVCGMEFETFSDVTIIAGYPYEESLQLMKPLALGSLLTRKGGPVILMAKSNSPMPEFFLDSFARILWESGGNAKEYVREKFERGELLLEDAPIDLNCALFFALVCKGRQRVVIVSGDLDPKQVERMGFVHYPDLNRALAGESAIKPKAMVNLCPVGGMLPILPKGHVLAY
jgi:nickel-dependent lactate racemase